MNISLIYEIAAFFTLGFLGGFGHCTAMCHPFVLYTSSRYIDNNVYGYKALIKPNLMYNLGRIITYATLGTVVSIFGGLVNLGGSLIGIQKIMGIAAGVLLLMYAIAKPIFAAIENKLTSFSIGTLLNKFSPPNPLIFGMIVGLVPCGLLYGALIGVSSMPNVFLSAFVMALFGIGTSFALVATAVFGNYIMRFRRIFNILSLVLMAGMGIFYIYSGITF